MADFKHRFAQGLALVTNARLKRLFDLCLSIPCLVIALPVIMIAWLIAALETRSNGFFFQVRVGRLGRLFKIIKIKSMYHSSSGNSVTVSNDPRITYSGRLIRKLKIDELPQLINVVKGDMSFVGPRPDVPGYADQLVGSDRQMLLMRPGITGLATLKYHNEELILSNVVDPIGYSNMVIWPDKVALNIAYMNNWSFLLDIQILLSTILPGFSGFFLGRFFRTIS